MDSEFINAVLNGTLYQYLLENSIYPDEEFKRAEKAAIESMKVPKKDNIFDYYEDEEDVKKESENKDEDKRYV